MAGQVELCPGGLRSVFVHQQQNHKKLFLSEYPPRDSWELIRFICVHAEVGEWKSRVIPNGRKKKYLTIVITW